MLEIPENSVQKVLTHLPDIRLTLQSCYTNLCPSLQDGQYFHSWGAFIILFILCFFSSLHFEQRGHKQLVNPSEVIKIAYYTTCYPGTAHLVLRNKQWGTTRKHHCILLFPSVKLWKPDLISTKIELLSDNNKCWMTSQFSILY